MSSASTEAVVPKRVRLWHGVAAFFAVILFSVVTVQPAQATNITLTGQQGMDIYREWDVQRTNSHPQNVVAFTFNKDNKNSNARLRLGLRNSAGNQFAVGEGSFGTRAQVKTNSGSSAIPGGSFYMNSRLISGSCGTGCGIISWEAAFSFNNRYL